MRRPPDILGPSKPKTLCSICPLSEDEREPAEHHVRLHDPGWDGWEVDICGTCLAAAQKAARQPEGEEDKVWEDYGY